MRLAHYLVHRPGGFAFRLVVPKHLRRHFGRQEIKRALGTHDPRLAQAWAMAFVLGYHRAIATIERTGMAWGKDDDDDLARALGFRGPAHRAMEWKATHPSGASLEGPDTGDADADLAAAIKASAALAAQYNSQTVPMAAPALPVPPPPGPPPGVKSATLGAAVAAWLATERPNFKTPARIKTFGKLKSTGEGFAAYAKPRTLVHNLGRADCAGFYDHLMAGGLARKTTQSVQSYLSRFFTWAAGRYYPADRVNPAAGHIRLTKHDKAASRGSGYQAFSRDQLRVMFDPAAFAALPTLKDRWMAVLALYTGARSNELARLELADIGEDEFDRVLVLDINELGEDKSVKAAASARQVPVHSDLVALGLLDRVAARKAAGETRLFPGNPLTQNGPAASSQRAFIRALEAWGIAPRGRGRMGLHSFRATVIQTMTRKGVSQGWRERFVGHEQSEQPSTLDTDHAATYGAGASALKATAAACLPALSWAADGIVDVAALRPLLATGATPEQAKNGPRQRAKR